MYLWRLYLVPGLSLSVLPTVSCLTLSVFLFETDRNLWNNEPKWTALLWSAWFRHFVTVREKWHILSKLGQGWWQWRRDHPSGSYSKATGEDRSIYSSSGRQEQRTGRNDMESFLYSLKIIHEERKREKKRERERERENPVNFSLGITSQLTFHRQ